MLLASNASLIIIHIYGTLRVMDWTEDYFNSEYAQTSLEGMDEERTKKQIDFILNLFGTEPPASIADVGCGLGRHTIELASRGYNVQGFDSNAQYLKKASEMAAHRGIANAFFVHKDMRELDIKSTFDILISVWVSFGYFDDETNADVFTRMIQAIKPGGNVFIDVENREYILDHYQPKTWKMKDDTLILDRSHFDHTRSVNVCKRTSLRKGEKRITQREIRLYSAHEIINLAKQEDLYDFQLFGNWDGSVYTVRSPRLIFTARCGL